MLHKFEFVYSVSMLMNVQIEIDQRVAWIRYAAIYLDHMNATVHQTSMEIHTYSVKNVIVLNVNARHHINLLVAIVYWLDAKMVDNVRPELNVSRLLVVLATVHALKDIEHNLTVVALMLMNVLKIDTSVALELVSFLIFYQISFND